MGIRAIIERKLPYTIRVKEAIENNLKEVTEKHKQFINNFDEFAKWFGNNLVHIENDTSFRNILVKNGFKFEKSKTNKNRWGSGWYIRG